MYKQPPKQPTIPPMPKNRKFESITDNLRVLGEQVSSMADAINSLANNIHDLIEYISKKDVNDSKTKTNIPLVYDDKPIGICKKLGNGYIECIIWDRCLTYEYFAEGVPDKQGISSVNIKT